MTLSSQSVSEVDGVSDAAVAFYKISEFKKHFCVKYQALKCKTPNIFFFLLCKENVSECVRNCINGIKLGSCVHMEEDLYNIGL